MNPSRRAVPARAIRRRLFGCGLAFSSLIALSAQAAADPAADTAAVERTLKSWRDDFNAGRADATCDIFAADVVGAIRGVPDRNKAELCEQIAFALSNLGREVHYDLDLHEILVSGDLAIARLTWTLKVHGDATTERGLDVFRRQPDGSWKIIRFSAFSDQGE